jgi:hypothetical protein
MELPGCEGVAGQRGESWESRLATAQPSEPQAQAAASTRVASSDETRANG